MKQSTFQRSKIVSIPPLQIDNIGENAVNFVETALKIH